MSATRQRVGVVLGTRPEAIKLAPVAQALAASSHLQPFVIFTGQHTDLLDGATQAFSLAPHLSLRVMSPGQSLASLTAALSRSLGEVMEREAFAAVLVQGDTTSAFVGALTAFYAGAPVGHVEAGLRTQDISQPFPEEANRRLISKLARWHFAPTAAARDRLVAEGTSPDAAFVTGNTGIDALLAKKRAMEAEPDRRDGFLDETVGPAWRDRQIVLTTIHRRENHGEPLQAIVRAVRRLAAADARRHFVLPVHANPKVQAPIRDALGSLANVSLLPPLGYDDLLRVLSVSRFVLTDSGGIQEEAPSFDVPVLILREQTERQEGVDAGAAILLGHDEESIVSEASRLFEDDTRHREMAGPANPYGDGTASAQIVGVLERSLA